MQENPKFPCLPFLKSSNSNTLTFDMEEHLFFAFNCILLILYSPLHTSITVMIWNSIVCYNLYIVYLIDPLPLHSLGSS